MKFKAYSQSLLRRSQKLYSSVNKENISRKRLKMVIKNSGEKNRREVFKEASKIQRVV